MTRAERTKDFFKDKPISSNKNKDNRLEIALIIHQMMEIRPYSYENFIRKYNNESLIKINHNHE